VIKKWKVEKDFAASKEEKLTLELMDVIGLEVVKSKKYFSERITKKQQGFIYHRMSFILNRCYVCGLRDHYAKNCWN